MWPQRRQITAERQLQKCLRRHRNPMGMVKLRPSQWAYLKGAALTIEEIFALLNIA